MEDGTMKLYCKSCISDKYTTIRVIRELENNTSTRYYIHQCDECNFLFKTKYIGTELISDILRGDTR